MPGPGVVSERSSSGGPCSQIVTLGLALRSMTLSPDEFTGDGVQARDDLSEVTVRDAADPDTSLRIGRGAWREFIRAVAAGEFGVDAQRRAA